MTSKSLSSLSHDFGGGGGEGQVLLKQMIKTSTTGLLLSISYIIPYLYFEITLSLLITNNRIKTIKIICTLTADKHIRVFTPRSKMASQKVEVHECPESTAAPPYPQEMHYKTPCGCYAVFSYNRWIHWIKSDS